MSRFPDSLVAPAGAVAVYIEPLHVVDSLALAAREMVDQGCPVVPIIDGGLYVGVVDEETLARALASGALPSAPLGPHATRDWPVLSPADSGASALRTIESSRSPGAVVVDASGSFVGFVLPSRLLAGVPATLRGRPVGGMATPFGVYLTNGVVSGGVGKWALVATGALIFSVFAVAMVVAQMMTRSLPLEVVVKPWYPWIEQSVTTVGFLVGMRLLPLTGTHAAEHMVVHAIERGEDLDPEVVRRMPRAHPRCGTNLAVAATVFLGIMGMEFIPGDELRLLLALIVTLAVWRPLGSLVQLFITTRRPNPKQLNAGIEAGRDLVGRIQTASNTTPNLGQRLWTSGLFQLMAGSLAVELSLAGLEVVLRVPDAWRVFSL